MKILCITLICGLKKCWGSILMMWQYIHQTLAFSILYLHQTHDLCFCEVVYNQKHAQHEKKITDWIAALMLFLCFYWHFLFRRVCLFLGVCSLDTYCSSNPAVLLPVRRIITHHTHVPRRAAPLRMCTCEQCMRGLEFTQHHLSAPV